MSSEFFFATSEKWKSVSATYVCGAAVSLLAVITAAYLHSARESRAAAATAATRSRTRFDYVIAGLLLVAMVYTFLRRKRARPPKWMGELGDGDFKFSSPWAFSCWASFRAT